MTNGLPQPIIFEGYDAGHYTLPDELVKLRDTFLKVQAQPYPEPPQNAWAVIERLATEVVDAVHNGTELPEPAQIEEARKAERIHQDVVDLIGSCTDLASQRVRAALHTHGMTLITDHLKPAHDKLWADYKAAWRTLQEYGKTEPRHLLAAPQKVRKASDTCDLLAERYTAIHSARTALSILGFRCTDDPNGKYAAIRNYHQLAPSRLAMSRPPWHGLATRHYLGWMVENGGELWLPTPDEQRQAVIDEAPDNSPLRRASGF